MLAALVSRCRRAARAALVADPSVLYQQMKDAYGKGAAGGWNYRSQQYYLSTIFNAGRAYSLQYPDDPAYGELATLTVQIGAGLHYNPLINHDAAAWWVREAADWVMKHGQDAALMGEAAQMLQRVNSEDAPEAVGALGRSRRDGEPPGVSARHRRTARAGRGQLAGMDIDARRRLALAGIPAGRGAGLSGRALPTTWGNDLVASASAASTENGYSAKTSQCRNVPRETQSRRSDSRHHHRYGASARVYMTTLAPADEYFGRMGMSILGIQNQLKHINFMLDYNYGNAESSETVLVAESIDDMHKVYPRDRDLPMLLYWCYTTLQRMSDAQSRAAAAHLRAILTVEYQDSPQARKILTGTS